MRETDAHNNADQILNRVISSLSEIANENGTFIPEDEGHTRGKGEIRTMTLKSHYGTKGNSQAKIDPAVSDSGETEVFGNNIEFFD